MPGYQIKLTTYHIDEQSKFISIHLLGFMLKEFACYEYNIRYNMRVYIHFYDLNKEITCFMRAKIRKH